MQAVRAEPNAVDELRVFLLVASVVGIVGGFVLVKDASLWALGMPVVGLVLWVQARLFQWGYERGGVSLLACIPGVLGGLMGAFMGGFGYAVPRGTSWFVVLPAIAVSCAVGFIR